MSRREAELLAEINRDLPKGVDWKQGAITYLREVIQDGGPASERYHLIKPFCGGPDYRSFWIDVFYFLDMIKAADLAPNDLVLDIGCGPGWTVQWLAKLGHEVIGLDISAELLEIAKRRMHTDPYPPYVDAPFRYTLHVHDIEEQPLGLERKARLALLESVLHHFLNPVAALRNVAADLADDGTVAVIEGAAPPKGSEWDKKNIEIMERYGTIERPFTRDQLLQMFELAGIPYVSFVRPVNGAFAQDTDASDALAAELASEEINTVFASPTAAGIERLGLTPRHVQELGRGMTLVGGGYGLERHPNGSSFRWCSPRAVVHLHGSGPHLLRVSTAALGPRETQTIHVLDRGKVRASTALTKGRSAVELAIPSEVGRLIEVQSDRAFSPSWTGGEDSRVLSFMLEVDASAQTGSAASASPTSPVRRLARSVLNRAKSASQPAG